MPDDNIVYCVIDGMFVQLPSVARFYMQAPTGIWCYTIRKPALIADDDLEKLRKQQMKDGAPISPRVYYDWTSTKVPIQYVTSQGFHRALKTACVEDWQSTLQKVIVTRDIPDKIKFGAIARSV